MRVCIASDTHNQLGEYNFAPVDLFIHCGDWTMQGTIEEVVQFNKDLLSVPAQHKIVIPGNHDMLAETDPDLTRKLITCADVLLSPRESCTYGNYKIVGTPYVPYCGRWAFVQDTAEAEFNHWLDVPEDTEILITHTPPMGILDTEPPAWLRQYRIPADDPVNNAGTRVSLGSKGLAARLPALKKLQFSFFGHIHGGYGTSFQNGVLFVNAACLERDYRTKNAPYYLEIPNK